MNFQLIIIQETTFMLTGTSSSIISIVSWRINLIEHLLLRINLYNVSKEYGILQLPFLYNINNRIPNNFGRSILNENKSVSMNFYGSLALFSKGVSQLLITHSTPFGLFNTFSIISKFLFGPKLRSSIGVA